MADKEQAILDEWGSDLEVAEWLVWYARRVGGTARDVAKRALDENPALRFTERAAAAESRYLAGEEGLDVEGAVAEALGVEAALSQAISRAGKLTALLAGIANRATPSPSPAELDVETVHRITCKGLIEHEPGSDRPYRWPCHNFAAEYAALRRTP